MKKIVYLLMFLFAGSGMFAGSANAVPITVGDSAAFFWTLGDGTGGTTAIGGTIETYELTIASATSVAVMLDDCCVVGDIFGLTFEGSPVSGETSGGSGGDLFSGTYRGFLYAGTYDLGVILEADCCGGGRGDISVGVAEPSIIALFALGLLGVGFAARRKNHS